MTDMPPKRPMSAYMMWLNSSREKIKSENPGMKVTELAKKGGEIWRATDQSVWEEKAAKAKEQYEKDLELYYASRGGGDDSGDNKAAQTKFTKKEVSAYDDDQRGSEMFAYRKKVNMTDMPPKRPMSAYMMWLNSSREKIKSENPGMKVTELAKKGGEIWRATDQSVWEEKAAKAKEQYEKDLELYYASRGGGDDSGDNKAAQTKSTKNEVFAYEDGEEEDGSD